MPRKLRNSQGELAFAGNLPSMIATGAKMPAVTLLDDEGREVDTTSLLGGPLVLWFYPKDDTPG